MILVPAAAVRNTNNATEKENKILSLTLPFMRMVYFFLLIFFTGLSANSQVKKYDTLSNGNVILVSDERFGKLGGKMTEYYEVLSKKTRLENGYRLMLMSSTDRNKVMALRSKLLQYYPDQKVYTIFQSPYIKLKFGNFLEREEAERMQKQISSLGLVDGNIYVVPEKVEVRPDKVKEELMQDE
jgi:hypothetical protein